MIPALLHGRVASGAGGVIAAPAYQTVSAFKTGASSAVAVASFSVVPDGTWNSTGTGFAAKSGVWYEPPEALIGEAYQVRMTLSLISGAGGVVTNPASGWVSVAEARTLQLSLSRYTSGTATIRYSVLVEFRPAIGGAVVSSASFEITCSVTVGGSGGGGCPAAGMWMRAGVQACDLSIGYRIDGVRAAAPETKVRLEVMSARRSWQDCVRIVTVSGAACVLSYSTPFTLRDGSTEYAPSMLGKDVLVDDGTGFLVWERVSECYPVGELEVIRINVGGESLLAGESASHRIVSHNQEKN